MTKESEAFFRKSLEGKTIQAREAVDHCIKKFLDFDVSNREGAAQSAVNAVDQILLLLHPSDHPQWLLSLHHELKVASSKPKDPRSSTAIQRVAAEFHPRLVQHQWNASATNAEAGIDFDGIFAKYRAESRVAELFDELITCLEEIIASEELDSRKAITELEKVVATLRSAKNGSYLATFTAPDFLKAWLANSAWEQAGKTPYIGSCVKGLQKTLKDFDITLSDLNTKIWTEISRVLEANFPRVGHYRPSLPTVSHSEYLDVKAEESQQIDE